MDYDRIRKHANSILRNRTAECDYIEYKKSSNQLASILKTICAFGNNYYDNDLQYIFIGVEETNDEKSKAIPSIPIEGIEEGSIEKCRSQLNHLRSFLYPNVSFDIIMNEFEGRKYLLIIVPRQTGGPFMVSDKAEKDKKINLKPGRYIRFEAESRIAKVNEEYDLLRKFSNYHFSSMANDSAVIDDLSIDYLSEYLMRTSDRKISISLDKHEIASSLKLLDKNDPSSSRVMNYAVLMFAPSPDQFIPYAYSELIVDMLGTKRKMESKRFSGPIWKQYENIVNYIKDSYLNTCVIRNDEEAENRKIENFPYVAIEELVANAIVHNNYENRKPIQIYVSESQINIVNYNKPLPPISTKDLNDRRVFNERDTENPEIRDMFKALGIIESFGTGIGEAKRSMDDNGSPALYYKIFSESDNVTSVVIPVSDEFISITKQNNMNNAVQHRADTKTKVKSIQDAGYSKKVKINLIELQNSLKGTVFGNSEVMKVLGCSETTATWYIKKMRDELEIIVPVRGAGKGRYCFTSKG